MNYFKIIDDNYTKNNDSEIISIKTTAAKKQIKQIKKTTNILWYKTNNGIKYAEEISFFDDIENGDWNEIFVKILKKLNIEFEEINTICI